MTEKIKSGRGLKKVGVLLLIIGTFGGPVLVTCLPHSVLPQINNYILLLLVLVITSPMIFVRGALYSRGGSTPLRRSQKR